MQDIAQIKWIKSYKILQLPLPLQILAQHPLIKGADQRGRQHVRNIRYKINQAKQEADALLGTIREEYGDTREIR